MATSLYLSYVCEVAACTKWCFWRVGPSAVSGLPPSYVLTLRYGGVHSLLVGLLLGELYSHLTFCGELQDLKVVLLPSCPYNFPSPFVLLVYLYPPASFNPG